MSENASQETVLDVGAEQLGKTYARALLGAASGDGSTETVLQQLAQVCNEYLASSPPLAMAFESPRVDVAEKTRVIDRLFGDWLHQHVLRLMKVMARRGRLGYLSAVRDAAHAQHDEAIGRVVAEVRTAVPLDDSLREEVTEQLSKRLSKTVRLKEIVDESVVGGMVVRIGDTVFDSSVAGRLERMQKSAAAGFAQQLMRGHDRFSSVS